MKEAKLYLDRAFAEASLTHVDTNIMNDQGVAMMAEKKFEAAERQFAKILKIDNAHAAAHNNMGTCLARRKRNLQALKHFKRAISCNKNWAPPWRNAARLFQSTGHIKQAIDHYEGALALEPGHAECRRRLCVARVAHRESELALTTYGVRDVPYYNRESADKEAKAHIVRRRYG